MLRCLLASLLCAAALVSAPGRARAADDQLAEYQKRQKVAAQALEQDLRDAVRKAQELKDDAPAALKLLEAALAKVQGDSTMDIAKRAEIRNLIEGAIKDAKNPKRHERPSLLDRLPPSPREQDEKIKAEIDAILKLQKEGKTGEAQALTDQLVSAHPSLIAAEQTKTVVGRDAAVKSDREVREGKGRAFEGQMASVNKSSNPGLGDYQLDPVALARAKEREKKLLEKLNPRTAREKDLLKWLASAIANPISFKDLPLEQALKILENELGTGLVINKRTLDELRLDYSTPVTVNVPRGASRRAVLNAFLEQLGMTYMIRNESIALLSKEEASKTLVTRVILVDSLVGGLASGLTGDALVKFIEDQVEPDSWKRNGGSGTITFYPGSRVLIIRNTSEVISRLEKGL